MDQSIRIWKLQHSKKVARVIKNKSFVKPEENWLLIAIIPLANDELYCKDLVLDATDISFNNESYMMEKGAKLIT